MVQVELVIGVVKSTGILRRNIRLFRVICVAFATLSAAPLAAQEKITPEEFLDIADGKTLTFTELRTGGLVGIEEYLSRRLSVWKDQSGICVYGKITIQNGQLCFLYDNDTDEAPVCWWTFRESDTLLVMLADLTNREIQIVTDITTDTLHCPSIPAV